MKPQNLLLLIIMWLLTVACRMGTGENAQLQNKENGINVIRYDKLLNEYVRSNSFSALQKMNMDYRQPTKILIEEVLGLGQVSDDTISQKLKKFYSDTTLLRLMADVEIRYPNLDEVEKGLTKGFENLRKEIPSFHTPVVYSQILTNRWYFPILCWGSALTNIWEKIIRCINVFITNTNVVPCVRIV